MQVAKLSLVLLLWSLGYGLPTADVSAPKVYSWSSGRLASEAYVVSRSDFSERHIRAMCEVLCAEIARTHTVWTLDFFVDRSDARRTLGGKGQDHYSYERWRAAYDEYKRHPLPEAKIFGLGRNVVLRIRLDDGTALKRVIGGHDFLSLDVREAAFQILDISVSRLPPLTPATERASGFVRVLVLSKSTPTKADARAIAQELLYEFGQEYLTVNLRSDTFFIGDSAAPVAYRFGQVGQVPAKEDFERERPVHCVAQPGVGIRC